MSFTCKDSRERVIKARVDEGEAFKLIRDFEPLIKKCIKIYVRNPEDFEDALQEGRVAIFKCIQKYDLSSKAYFEGYVKMAVIYCIRDFAGKHKENASLDEELSEGGGSLYNILDSGMDIEGDEIKRESLEDLRAALTSLSDKERQLLNEFYFQKKTLRELSMGRRCHYMTLVKQKERTIEKLRRAMGG